MKLKNLIFPIVLISILSLSVYLTTLFFISKSEIVKLEKEKLKLEIQIKKIQLQKKY